MYPLFADQKPGCNRVGIFLSEQTSQNHGPMLDLVCLPKNHSNIHRSCHMGIDQNLLSQYFRDEHRIDDN